MFRQSLITILIHSNTNVFRFPTLNPTAIMGCGMSTEEKEGKQRNEEIENQLKKDRMSQRNEIKMLLLGSIAASTPLRV